MGAIARRGFTERQARFLATVALHSGVFVGRQYAAFVGITHGQKVHDFIEKLLVRRFITAIELGSTGRKKIFHVHHKPLYAAIGEPDNRNRRPITLDKAIERLMIVDGVLADRSLTWLGSEREKRAYFRARVGDRLRDDEYPRLVFGKAPNQTVRYFADKLPIGFEKHGYRHVLVYSDVLTPSNEPQAAEMNGDCARLGRSSGRHGSRPSANAGSRKGTVRSGSLHHPSLGMR